MRSAVLRHTNQSGQRSRLFDDRAPEPNQRSWKLTSGREIIASGEAMRSVFELLSRVASFDTTVLISGETGTGKELFAAAVHELSARRGGPLVKVNCAALPSNLIESELFGHERGSFTGAVDRRIGKFEQACGGTLFLDEISEMPVEAQAKLLRAIQEKEIERVGGRTVIRTDVRIIAATNRDLLAEAESGRFRPDLYYRLNVFPVTLPALRERREDIPALVAHFVEKFARRFGREHCFAGESAIRRLVQYDFPGNVRELENIVERAVLLTDGDEIRNFPIPSAPNKSNVATPEAEGPKTHEQNERDHIVRALELCRGKLSGPGSAAEFLDLHVSTLRSKIKKLKISKEYC